MAADHADPGRGDVGLVELHLESEPLQHRLLRGVLPLVARSRGMQVGDGLADVRDLIRQPARRVVAPLVVVPLDAQVGGRLGIPLGTLVHVGVGNGVDRATRMGSPAPAGLPKRSAMRLSVNRPRMRPAGVSVSHVYVGNPHLVPRKLPGYSDRKLGTALTRPGGPSAGNRSEPASAATAAEHAAEDVQDRGLVGLGRLGRRRIGRAGRLVSAAPPRPSILPRMSVSTLAPLPPEAPAISGPSRSPYLPPATCFDRYASTIGARIGSSFIRSPDRRPGCRRPRRRGSGPPGRYSGRRCC